MLTDVIRYWDKIKLQSVQLRRHCNSKATPTSRQSIWHIISIFCFFCSKILRFGKFRLATTNAEHVAPRPFSTLNKQQIRTDFAVNLRCLLHTLWPWPLTLWPWTNVLAVTWWNSVLNSPDLGTNYVKVVELRQALTVCDRNVVQWI